MNELRLLFGFVMLGAGSYVTYLLSKEQKPILKNSLVVKNNQFKNSGFMKFESEIKMWITPAKGQKYESAFKAATVKYNLPDGLLSRVAFQESRYNPTIVSPKGAIGLMQFMPPTAKQYGINPLNPEQSIEAAGKYLASLYKQFGNWQQAVASYNWGQGNVARKGLARAPLETRNYYSEILNDIGLA